MNRERDASSMEERKVWTRALHASLSGSVSVCLGIVSGMQNTMQIISPSMWV